LPGRETVRVGVTAQRLQVTRYITPPPRVGHTMIQHPSSYDWRPVLSTNLILPFLLARGRQTQTRQQPLFGFHFLSSPLVSTFVSSCSSACRRGEQPERSYFLAFLLPLLQLLTDSSLISSRSSVMQSLTVAPWLPCGWAAPVVRSEKSRVTEEKVQERLSRGGREGPPPTTPWQRELEKSEEKSKKVGRFRPLSPPARTKAGREESTNQWKRK